MPSVNVAEAKARLSELIDAALDGEEVVIARRNVPMVKLTVVKSKKNVPKLGLFKGRIRMSQNFDEPLVEFAEYMPEPAKLGRRPRR